MNASADEEKRHHAHHVDMQLIMILGLIHAMLLQILLSHSLPISIQRPAMNSVASAS